ncbi:MAG: hypothetical protein AAGL89_04085 [Pseudomonadota bacterium]
MRLLALLMALWAAPVAAWDRMLRSDCQVAFEAFAGLMGGFSDLELGQTLVGITVTADGWCDMKSGGPGMENARFDRLQWRAEEISRWTRDGIPPLALDLRLTGLDPDEIEGTAPTNRPPLTFEATLRQIPEAGQVIAERVALFNEAGDSVSMSGVFERVFLSSQSMMQVSVGSVAFKAGVFVITFDGRTENPFGVILDAELRGQPDALRQQAFDFVTRLPSGVVSNAARAELTAFAGDLPGPEGTLEVLVNSERGLGIMQIGMAAYADVAALFADEDDSAYLEILLDGLTIDADWSPAEPIAD